MPGKRRVFQVLEATIGGTRRHLRDLCLRLPPDEFDLHVIVALGRTPEFAADLEAFRERGLRVTVLPMVREPHLRQDPACARALRDLIRAEQPQVVHGHSAKGGFLARYAARQVPGVATVYNPHAFPFQMQTAPWRQAAYLALERWAGRWTDRLIALCPSQRDLAVARGIVPSERVVIIPNGVDARGYADASSRVAVRAEWGIGPQEPLLGTVAALTPQKDVGSLVRALALLRVDLPARLVVIGDGPLRAELERLAEGLELGEAVRFLGQRDDVPRLLPALDCFVLPSLWEGLPYALLEAGAAGRPVVATDIPGNSDLVTSGETGLLVKPGSVADLASGLRRGLTDPARLAWAQALRQRVHAAYSLEQMIARHVALYRELSPPSR